MKKFEHIVKVCILIFSMLSVNLTAWGLDEYKTIVDFYSSTTYDGSQLNNVNDGVFSKTDNHVTFTINNLNKYTYPCLVYSTIGYPGSKESTFGWSTATHYEVKVTAVSIGLRGYEAAVHLTPAYGQFKTGSTTGSKIDCKTNAVGGSGASTVNISNNSGLGSSAQLNMSTTSDKPYTGSLVKIYANNCEFAITTVTYTYKVTHKEYLFGFAAVANKNISAAGNVSASVKDETVQAAVGVTSASTVATFTASANDGYRFEGWYDNSSYSGTAISTKSTYQPTLSNSKAGSVETKTLYAKFVPVTVNSVTAMSSTLYFTEPGTKLDTLTFNVSNADAKADFNAPTISNNEWTLTSWNYSNNKVTVVVSYTVTKDTSKDSDHAATITLTSKGSSDSQSQSATVSVSLNMNPVFTCNIHSTYLVDDAAINLASLWTSTSNGTISYTIENFVPSGINNDGAKEPKIVNNMLSLGQAGLVELKLTQAASVSYNEGWTTKTITIDKYDNVITISGFDNKAHEIKTDWYDNVLTLTASNTDYTHFPIYNERTQGDDTQASFGRQEGTTDKWVVYTGQNTGVVEWRLWQDENYKYKAGETTFMVNVINNPNCTCNLVDMSWKKDYPTVSTVGNKGYIDFGGIGETLSFELDRNLAAGNAARYRLRTNDSWSGYESAMDSSVIGGYTQIGPIALGTGKNNTTAVEFAKGSNWITGLNTDDPYINNIKVTRKRWMKILRDSKTEITSLPKMERDVDADPKDAIFYVDFSTCDTIVKVTSDCDHITFGNNLNRDTIAYNTATVATRGFNDLVAVPVYYYSDVAEEKTVTITIYTEYENKTITVKVKTVGFIFEGGNGDDWTEPKNWNIGRVPGEVHDVTIKAAAVVSTEQTVRRMDITTGSVTIAPQGGLTIGKGGISGATTDNLILKADADAESKTKGQTGYLRISPEYKGAMPQATVELFSIAYYNMKASDRNNEATWQYVGSPMVGGASARPTYPKSMLYDWSEITGKWTNNLRDLVLQPFTGYATSQYRNADGMLISNKGQLVANANVVLDLTYTEKSATPGCNVFANSYAAPIDITLIDTTDFSDGVEATIHLFNTGSKVNIREIKETKSIDVKAAGQYLSIPVKNAIVLATEFKYPSIIPSMQGFYVNTNKAGTLTLDYSKLVWNSNNPNKPLRVKANYSENAPITASLMLTLSTDSLMDNLFLLESEDYAPSYENGYDAHKMMKGTLNIFAVEGEDNLSVDATNSIKGTRIGVRTGEEMTYTLDFARVRTDRELLLFDNETNQIIDIYEGLEYTFNAEPDTIISDRFQILEREKEVPEVTVEVTTAIKNAEKQGVKVNKFIKDNQLYILKNGVLYNAVGARVH